MGAGDYDRLITILRPGTPAVNSAGETETPYPDALASPDVFAEVKQQTAREFIRNGATSVEAPYAIRIRWLTNVTEKCRILYEGRTLEISHVGEIGRRVELQIVATEVRS